MEYPWYCEISEPTTDITQGDILYSCPVVHLADGTENQATPGESKKVLITNIDGIIMTQACDIANNKVADLTICPVTPWSEYAASMEAHGKSSKEVNKLKENIIRGRVAALHMLNKYDGAQTGLLSGLAVVNFKEIYSLPMTTARCIAANIGPRMRLLPPYREHLSQAFARFFMRVGLPEDINPSEC